MSRPKDIVIAGSGLAGLSLAEKLVGATDARVTLVAPHVSYTPDVDIETRLSSPIIPLSTVQRLGLDVSQTPEVRETYFGPISRGPVKSFIGQRVKGFFDARFDKLGFFAIDIETARQRVLSRVLDLAESNDQLLIRQGTVYDVQRDGGRVTGVKIRGQEQPLRADLVVDATGKSARLASKLERDEIEIVKLNQQGSLLGGYLSLDMDKLTPSYPGIEKVVYIDILPGGVALVLTPAESIPQSPATHGLLIEGNSQRIQAAHKSVSAKLPSNERQLLVLQEIAKGTPWEDILAHAYSLDRHVVYHHQDNIKRTPLLPGIVFLGDAQGFVSPINGTGLSYAAKDTERLVDAVSTHGIDEGADLYTELMRTIFRKRFRDTKRYGQGVRALGVIFNSM